MTTPQRALFDERSCSFLALEYAVAPGRPAAAALREALARLLAGGPAAEGASLAVAFGPALWRQLSARSVPEGLRDFEPLHGWQGHDAPATQRDLLLWVHGLRPDLVFDRALAAHRALGASASLALEVPGFTYHDSRDLTGFIDGTANPVAGARFEAALVPEGKPGAGGSFVLGQKWVHDLAGWADLPVAEQERVIGRRKADSAEMDESERPADSHVGRVEVEEDGAELALYRRSFPYGGVAEHGLYFLAFSCELRRFDLLLRRMFGLAGDGLHDALTAHSRPVSGSYWFAPCEDDLAALFGRGQAR